MSSAVVSDRRRSEGLAEAGGDAAQDEHEQLPASERPSRTTDARFVGNAMKSLFASADVSIARGDETRVLSRAQDALLQVEQRSASQPPPADDSELLSTTPPGPRVDAVLWLVLAGGLFAIAGWMVAYGL